MKLEGGERLVLRNLLDLQGDSQDYILDSRLAAATRMAVQDVRDWLETLEGKGLVERTRLTDGFSAYVTPKGKQALRLTEPISTPKPAGESGSVNVAPLGGTGAPVTLPVATQNRVVPIRLFYSYSHKDEALRDELEEHLALLKRQGCIVGWHDRRIGAGDEWKGQLDKNLEEAQIILLLISPSFLASDYCYDIETKRALERHDKGEAKVIPVLLRPVDWEGAPFARLQGLPIDLRPVTTWTNKDEAFKNIAQGIRRVVEELTANSPVEPQGNPEKVKKTVKVTPEEFTAVARVLQRMEDKLLSRINLSNDINQYVLNPTESMWKSIVRRCAQVTDLDAKVKDFKDRLPDSFFVDERLSYRNLIGILDEKEKLISEIENMKHPVSGDQLDELRKISKGFEDLRQRIDGLGDKLERYAQSITK